MERSGRGGPGRDIAEGLERAAILMVRHPPDRAALNPTALLTLSALEREGPVRVTTLAAAAGISQPAMTGMIQRLERKGLVRGQVKVPSGGQL